MMDCVADMERLNDIRRNAQAGDGPCRGCPAQEASGGEFVNPGLVNPEGELVFVTEEPRHPTDWSEYDSWAAYNEDWAERFANATGGRFINRLLSKTDLRLPDVWVADSIKCPTKRDDQRGIPACDTDGAFAHCRAYLGRELDAIDPQGVVTLGKGATIRTLRELGVPDYEARQVRVTEEYGSGDYDTDYPVVISLHWAQRTVAEREWVPVVQEAIAAVVDGS